MRARLFVSLAECWRLTFSVNDGRSLNHSGVRRLNDAVEKITGAPAGTFRNFAHKSAEVWQAAK
jgi:hypothetical protein